MSIRTYSGTSPTSLASCAVRHLAPFGIWRRSASRAVRHLAPFGLYRGTIGERRSAARTRSLTAASALSIDVGVPDVSLVVEDRDSVMWSVDTRPAECATVAASPERLAFSRRDRHCSARWTIHAPASTTFA